jgi:hypothetical protein
VITVSTKMQVGEELTVPRPGCAVFVVADDAPLLARPALLLTVQVVGNDKAFVILIAFPSLNRFRWHGSYLRL